MILLNSLDVTPNGSLRRRRSRIPSEEDDHKLMDYLHTSGHDGSRERKSLSGNVKLLLILLLYWVIVL